MVSMSLLQDVLFKYWLSHLPNIEKVIQSGGALVLTSIKRRMKMMHIPKSKRDNSYKVSSVVPVQFKS